MELCPKNDCNFAQRKPNFAYLNPWIDRAVIARHIAGGRGWINGFLPAPDIKTTEDARESEKLGAGYWIVCSFYIWLDSSKKIYQSIFNTIFF